MQHDKTLAAAAATANQFNLCNKLNFWVAKFHKFI